MVQCVKDAALSLQWDPLACNPPHAVGEAKKKNKKKNKKLTILSAILKNESPIS